MQRLRQEIDLVAGSDLPVLITGETGVGKELVASAVHANSRRADEPLVQVNCAALPETLAESELFGHLRGAFTGATADRTGMFEVADGGTLFLDEIGELPPTIQPKLLRALQQGEVQRIGADRVSRVDVRIIAATNRDLGKAVRDGRFREDLYYRLKVIPVTLPPLRERTEDIPLLVKYFVDGFNREFKKSAKGVTSEALERLITYPWPGNVRELRNVIERAMILENKPEITLQDLPREIRDRAVEAEAPAAAPSGFHLPETGFSLKKIEQEMVRQALEKSAGNQSRAARLLSISRDTLRYKMKKYGLL
jgi:transcriptional regulator with GAF, ATPase, and Fis domain